MSFDKIGTGKAGAPLVLAELNETERLALSDILLMAEISIGEGKSGMRASRGRGQFAVMMISELRRVHEIEG